jgi:uncharacterized protein YecT (DUF1311 family)
MIITKRIFAAGLLTVTLSLAFSISAKAQSAYEATLEKIDAQHQDCLDQGENTIACSGNYYAAMDSMLNVVYKAALKDLPNTEKADLRNEQREWLINRNAKFKEIDGTAKQDGNGSLERGIAIEDKATHVRERVDELIGKLK